MENLNNPTNPILEIIQVSKEFSGVYALRNVDFQLRQGEVTAIIGENGAGKSTLMKIISGVYSDFDGEIILNGKKVTYKNPKEAAKNGVVIIHQELNLIPYLTVTENLFLGNELLNSFGLLDYPRMREKARELLGRLHLDIDPDTPLFQLRVGQQQLVEIAKALMLESKVLIMDEPTSAISDHEVALLFQIIRELKTKGVAIVYISHKLNELYEIADCFTVLRDGEKVGSGRMAGTTSHQLIQMMVGRKLLENGQRSGKITNSEVLRVDNLSVRNPELPGQFLVREVSFSLRKGEVIGICGLMGAGRTEVLEAIFGLYPAHISGKIFIDGFDKQINSIRDAIDAGIGLVPEDRKRQGLILNMNVTRNTTLASLEKVSKYAFIQRFREEEVSSEYVRRLKTAVKSAAMEVQMLSGGNQQKVVIAKWLATHPKILLLDEPTRGIDVGAKTEIYQLIAQLAEQGMGIIVVSSELPEILAVSDTIIVMSESRVTAKLQRNEATEEIIMKAALRGKEQN